MNYLKLYIILFFPICIFSKTSFPGFSAFTSSIQLSLGGAGFLNSSPISSSINPSSYIGELFSFSLIRYPASITSQSAGVVMPFLEGTGNISVNNISYGTFQGYNENAESIGTYNSNDFWLTTSYAKSSVKHPIRLGLSSSIYSSSYNNHRMNILTFAIGSQINLKQYKVKLGLTIQEIGKSFGSLNTNFSPQIILSGSKQLAHLPLQIYLDVYPGLKNVENINLGGVFDINKFFQIYIGSSMNKIKQNINHNLFTTITGATGIGFRYIHKSFSIHYSIFTYGTGAIIHGIEFGSSI